MKKEEKTALTKMRQEKNRKSGLTDTELGYLKAAEFPKKKLEKLRIKTGGRVK